MVYVPLGSATGSMYHGVAMGDHEAFSYATYDRPTYDRLAPVQRLPRISSWIGNDSSNSPWIGNEEFEWRSRKFEVQSKRLPPSPEKAVAAARTLPASLSLPKLEQPARGRPARAVIERAITGKLVPLETPPAGQPAVPEPLVAHGSHAHKSLAEYDRAASMGIDAVTMYVYRKQRGKSALAPHNLHHHANEFAPRRTRMKPADAE